MDVVLVVAQAGSELFPVDFVLGGCVAGLETLNGEGLGFLLKEFG